MKIVVTGGTGFLGAKLVSVGHTGKLPSGVWLPDTGVAPYRGRG